MSVPYRLLLGSPSLPFLGKEPFYKPASVLASTP